MSAYVACGCGRRMTRGSATCFDCRYPKPRKRGRECPDCKGPKAEKARHCQFCWGAHDRNPARKGPRQMSLKLTAGVDEALDLLARSWALGRADVVYRLVLAAARQTERELRRDKVA